MSRRYASFPNDPIGHDPESLDGAIHNLRLVEAGCTVHFTPTRAAACLRIIDQARDAWIGEQIEKDHQIRELVNELRDTAIDFAGSEQLRERIAKIIVPHLKELVELRYRMEGLEK